MSRPYYDGHSGSRPEYYNHYPDDHYQQRPNPRNNNTRIPRAPYAQSPAMRDNYSTPSPARGPPGPARENYYPEHSTWDDPQHLYDGTGYEEDYGHYDQWPLPAHYYEPTQRGNGSPRHPPQRPQRPEDSDQQFNHRNNRAQFQDSNYLSHADRQYQHYPSSHHGNGHWNGDGYSYAPPAHPPPNRPPPQNPQPRQAQASLQYPPPQIPPPAAYNQANRRAPLGPPPSARRGPATYYPDVGLVHPIFEETDSMRSSSRIGSVRTAGHDSKTSFASSNAIPIGISQVYLDNHAGGRPSTLEHASIPEDDYYVSDMDDENDPTLRHLERTLPPSREQESPEMIVRQASVGRKSKPTLTQVRSGDRTRKSSSAEPGIVGLPSPQHVRTDSSGVSPDMIETERSRAEAQDRLEGQAGTGAVGDEEENRRGSSPIVATPTELSPIRRPKEGSGSRTPEEVLRSGTGLLDASDSSSESENELRRKRSKDLLGASIAKELHPQRAHPRSPLAPRDEDRVKSILDNLEKGGAITADDALELKKPMGGMSERVGKLRPPRLDVDAVREAEARGSLTSLPDLIKRATKLASNLDRGKTASRLGMNWFEGANEGEKRRSGSIHNMLNAFPSPMGGSPTGSRGEKRRSMMSGHMQHSALPSDSDPGEANSRKRRCCGMPLWLFVLLILLLFILVAAAVVIPVIFVVVLPKQDSHDNDAAASRVGSCERKLTCNNGGTNILSSNGFCECLCVNGYLGVDCSTFSEQGCTSISIGSTSNVTVGESIPRLLDGASSNFSIPLDSQEVLGLFSSSDLNCVGQNALVTFNNAAAKRSHLVQRETATSDGIVYATGSPTSTVSPPTSTTTSSTASSSAMDFARVAVLFVLQTSGQISTAATAQENLQSYFHDGKNSSSGEEIDMRNLRLGNDTVCDLASYTITLSNGTIVGGGS